MLFSLLATWYHSLTLILESAMWLFCSPQSRICAYDCSCISGNNSLSLALISFIFFPHSSALVSQNPVDFCSCSLTCLQALPLWCHLKVWKASHLAKTLNRTRPVLQLSCFCSWSPSYHPCLLLPTFLSSSRCLQIILLLFSFPKSQSLAVYLVQLSSYSFSPIF